MPTLVGILLTWAAAGAVDGGAPPETAAPSTEPTALGASLHLPRPRVLPCERFQTVEVEVGGDVDHLSYDEGASIEWRADPQGRLLLTYMPIDTVIGPAEAVMFLKREFLGPVNSSILLRATSGQRGDDDLPGTSLSVPLLSVH